MTSEVILRKTKKCCPPNVSIHRKSVDRAMYPRKAKKLELLSFRVFLWEVEELTQHCIHNVKISFITLLPTFVIKFVYQKALIQIFHSSILLQKYLCEFTTWEHKLNKWFCTQKPVLNVCFKNFWYTKIKIWHVNFN